MSDGVVCCILSTVHYQQIRRPARTAATQQRNSVEGKHRSAFVAAVVVVVVEHSYSSPSHLLSFPFFFLTIITYRNHHALF